ncbi:asparagine synthase (glutamine-hydrolyzing) [Sinorhizobium meliloti]|uniref:asparagine synthase (glutamine-hydrolyzing) n=1 Tax=Rhizobium meliloti TaxID=382 RepID=UPI0013E2C17D|nr:asparagine synthase (glutamine-hydrolyzing) [Sinorhizobium meliloti]
MCGLLAIRAALPIAADSTRHALDALAHRGPDGRGTWAAPDGKVILGHARLSIIDLAGGSQPLVNEDGTIAAVVTGEFYGFRAIREELESEGHRFRTGSDSEILLHLYERQGMDAVHRLRGEFAFVLWDDQQKRMIAGRDRFGIKPLFYAQSPKGLFLASEIKALLALGVTRGWDAGALHQHLLACMADDRTLFAGIRQVPPACILIASETRTEVRRYWHLDYPADSALLVPPDDEELSASIRDAVSIRLVSDVPIGCMLSGGLDSSLVLSLAARESSQRIAAFTATFNHPVYDEAPRARIAAKHAGASLHEVPISQHDLAAHFSDAIWHAEGLCFNGHAVARYLLAREIRRAGIKTVVAGDGADELFAGYLFSVADAAEPPGPRPAGDRRPALLLGLEETRAPIRPLLAEDFTAQFSTADPLVRLAEEVGAERVARCHPVTRSLYIWARSLLPQYVLAAERLDLAHGVEVRQPLLDHCLFELVKTIPAPLMVEQGTTKAILRRVASAFLPRPLVDAPKHPFTAPPATLDPVGPFMEYLQDLLRGRELQSVPFFDRAAVIGLLDALPRMTTAQRLARDAPLMMVASVCLLQQRLLVSGSV